MQKQRFSQYRVLPAYVFLAYLFMYVPIVVLILFSFNKDPFEWTTTGWTYEWYVELLTSPSFVTALLNSFVVAVSAMTISIVLGTLFVVYMPSKFAQHTTPLFYISLLIPEIVFAVSLLTLFSFFSVSLNLFTLIVGHTVLGLGYVVPIVYARYSEFDTRLIEASLDLGATYTQTLYKVVLPYLSPALFGAALLVFIISFDDFIIAFFCAGSTHQTLPMYIFSLLRSTPTPAVNALSTLLLIVSGILVLIFSSLHAQRWE
jgi:spermidine/putrescine transport system permease protein